MKEVYGGMPLGFTLQEYSVQFSTEACHELHMASFLKTETSNHIRSAKSYSLMAELLAPQPGPTAEPFSLASLRVGSYFGHWYMGQNSIAGYGMHCLFGEFYLSPSGTYVFYLPFLAHLTD